MEFKSYLANVAALKALEDKADKAIEEAANYFVVTGRMEIQKNLYPGHGLRTGHLRSSYQGVVVERRKLYAKVKLYTETSYAPFVEFCNGGKIAHFRPGISVTITKTSTFYKAKMSEAMK